MKKRYVIEKSGRVDLDDFDPKGTGGLQEGPEIDAKVKNDLEDLSDLQNLLYAARCHAVLIVLQGIDTAGKDGTIKHVFSGVNPQGCRVASFKQPTEIELAHDYLWRVHAVCPAKGEIVVFNRSHYESVLVEGVHDLVPEKVWKKRYDEIVSFERLLHRSGTIILKFFLNLSKGEQKRRLLERERDPRKRWKVNRSDWEERKLWNAYRAAYEEMLSKTSTSFAPWIVVPSDAKWYRNLVVADAITDRLRPFKDEWEEEVERRGAAAMKR
ncbi:MAG TPA: PPK2 family polyphosphate kinase [Thermoanaerobaculia bacterium]|nr:PPK2 family polyphosphate kinase [Thermoanaerobaculia bacterium]